MILCGVLHVTYQSPEYIIGEYMVCALFNSYFLLCRVNDDYRRLQAVACLYVSDMKFDTLRNGRGEYWVLVAEAKLNGNRTLLLRVFIFVEIGIPGARGELRARFERIVSQRGESMEN